MHLGRFQFAKYMECLRVNILKERIPRGLYMLDLYYQIQFSVHSICLSCQVFIPITNNIIII